MGVGPAWTSEAAAKAEARARDLMVTCAPGSDGLYLEDGAFLANEAAIGVRDDAGRRGVYHSAGGSECAGNEDNN